MPPGSAVEPRGVESGVSARVRRRRRPTRAEMPDSSKRARRARCARRCGDIVSASSTPDGGRGGPDARACGGPVSKSATKARDRSECSKRIVVFRAFFRRLCRLATPLWQIWTHLRSNRSHASGSIAGRAPQWLVGRAERAASRREPRARTDLGAEPDRSRCGTEPISTKGYVPASAPVPASALPEPARRRRRELATTMMLEAAMAAPAIIGLSSPAAASGIAATL